MKKITLKGVRSGMILWFIVLGIFLYLIPIKVQIYFKAANDNIFIIKTSIFFITITKKINKPISKILALLSREDYNKGEVQEALNTNIFPKNADIILKRVMDDIPRFLQIIKSTKIFKLLRCKKMKLYTEIGLSDAYKTGLIIGALWTITGIILGKLSSSQMLRSKKPKIGLVPIFYTKRVFIEYDCIITFPLGHIILIYYQIVRFLIFSKKYKRRLIYE